jgi:signal peptidase II
MSYLVWIGGLVLILDQLTKILVVHYLPLYSSLTVIPEFFNLVHVRNTGAAFSFMAGDFSTWRQTFFITVSVIGIAVAFYIYRGLKSEDRWARIALALILGGALGNLVDRVRLGEVIDFIDIYIGSYHWPAFNVADSAISIGAVLLLVVLLRSRDDQSLAS